MCKELCEWNLASRRLQFGVEVIARDRKEERDLIFTLKRGAGSTEGRDGARRRASWKKPHFVSFPHKGTILKGRDSDSTRNSCPLQSSTEMPATMLC